MATPPAVQPTTHIPVVCPDDRNPSLCRAGQHDEVLLVERPGTRLGTLRPYTLLNGLAALGSSLVLLLTIITWRWQ